MKMKTLKEYTEASALEEIARIRRVFDPGDVQVKKLIRDNGPDRARAILLLAARFGSTLGTVH